MPFLVSLVSRNGKAIAACLLASIPRRGPHRRVMAWSVGIL